MRYLSYKEVSARADAIATLDKVGSDPERAHSMEDSLFADVLQAIAETGSIDRARKLAQYCVWVMNHALEVGAPRWTA